MILFPFFRIARKIVALVLVVALVYVTFVAARVWWTARQDDRRPSDVIVVLGAAQFDGRPSEVFQARLDHAKALYDDGVAERIVTVGGSRPGDRFTEAAAGKRYLVEHGAPRERVVAVESGADTLESLRAVAAVLDERGWHSAVLVTDPPHALRAREIALDEGIEAVSSPARSGPAVRERSTQLRYIARETGALLYYQVFARSFGGDGPDAL